MISPNLAALADPSSSNCYFFDRYILSKRGIKEYKIDQIITSSDASSIDTPKTEQYLNFELEI